MQLNNGFYDPTATDGSMMIRDPVCGMAIAWEEAADFEIVGGNVIYFCCAGCAARFRHENGNEASGVLLADIPRVGALRLDAFEKLFVDEWRRNLGYAADQPCVCRVVERALLSLALADTEPARRHRLDVLVAAEAARLHMNRLDRDRVSLELRALPASLRVVLQKTGLSAGQQARLVGRVTHELPDILSSMERRSSGRVRWRAEVPEETTPARRKP